MGKKGSSKTGNKPHGLAKPSSETPQNVSITWVL